MSDGRTIEILRTAKRWGQRSQQIVVAVQPWAVILAVAAFILAAYELEMGRRLRQASLFVSAVEVAQLAREASKDEDAKIEIGQSHVFQAISRSGTSLRGLNAKDLRIEGVDLAGVDLRDAHFWGTQMSGVDLTGADLSGAVLSEAFFHPIHNRETLICSDLTNANLERSQLTDATIFFSTFAGANFSDAALGANFLCHVDLSGADFTGAKVWNPIALYGVDLSGARGLTNEQTSLFCGQDVSLPDGQLVKACSEDGARDECYRYAMLVHASADSSIPGMESKIHCSQLLSRSRDWMDEYDRNQQQR